MCFSEQRGEKSAVYPRMEPCGIQKGQTIETCMCTDLKDIVQSEVKANLYSMYMIFPR